MGKLLSFKQARNPSRFDSCRPHQTFKKDMLVRILYKSCMNKQCLICNLEFPSRITIDGKKHSLINRKHCLRCVPFKSKNGNGKQYSQWSEARKARHRAVAASKGLQRKKTLVNLAGGKCQICGYDKCLRALTFHHRSPDDKKFELNTSEMKSKNWDLVLLELNKCDLLCVRCHVEIHDKEFEHYINVKVGTSPGEGITNFPCGECGVDRKHQSPNNLCDACSKNKRRKIERPNFDVLQIQIEKLGYTATGRLYGVSDNAIRKWVKSYKTNLLVARKD